MGSRPRTFCATLVVLITIVITMLLIRTLGLASKGSVNPEEILLVLTYTVLGRLPTVLTLALFIGLVFALTVVKVTQGEPMQAFDHVVRPELAPSEAEDGQ